ncbi:transporter [Lachnospiraceae bacterium DSM 108991]|uniref:Transporter n=1 Tax=Claveliimonas monacensis TaxID=2779351 RepID=A0ABR9RIP8_9FIRM|nr:Na+/H+ antiporter NhaC family protein [Claveliimonas monacensis]MBE5062477.1 transporter [Claveliimonas monacensis]
METMGFISVIPAILAIVLSFITRNTIVSLTIACIAGTLLAGQGIFGFPTLLQNSLGTTSFSWVMLLNTFIGILVAYFQKTGAIQGFSQKVHEKNLSRRGAQLMAWVLGIFIYFSDSFSPLFVGSVMRSITDKAKVSREKLAYIADSTSAPVSVLMPITGWAAYLMGLAVGVGCIATTEDASRLFLRAIPFNFYPIFAVLFVGLLASGIIKDFGPMKKAEKRAWEEGKVIRDGATPLIGKELTDMQPYPGLKPRVVLNFILPVFVIIGIALGTYIAFDSAKTMEAFLFVVIIMTISMMIQGISFKEVMNTLTDGVKGAIPAVMLPAVIFAVAAIMSFATGSSWGTFAICMPIALPLAFSFTDNQMSLLIVACFAAVAGGGVFGDHCSPLSDTTVLSSTGAASDHIDHVKTQLPYALICGLLAFIAYLIIGIFFIQ